MKIKIKFTNRADLKAAYGREEINMVEYKKHLAWIVLGERLRAQEKEQSKDTTPGPEAITDTEKEPGETP